MLQEVLRLMLNQLIIITMVESKEMDDTVEIIRMFVMLVNNLDKLLHQLLKLHNMFHQLHNMFHQLKDHKVHELTPILKATLDTDLKPVPKVVRISERPLIGLKALDQEQLNRDQAAQTSYLHHKPIKTTITTNQVHLDLLQ
jgi:hypothetical protein